MEQLIVRFQRLRDEAKLPTKAHADDACFDLYSAQPVGLEPGKQATVTTGFNIAIPDGYVGLVCSRSGMASRGVFVTNAPGVVDAGYRGELKVLLHNAGHAFQGFEAGYRIAQLMVVPVIPAVCAEVPTLDETTRGEKGFGSTGN